MFVCRRLPMARYVLVVIGVRGSASGQVTLPRTVWPPHQGHFWRFKTRISNPQDLDACDAVANKKVKGRAIRDPPARVALLKDVGSSPAPSSLV
jgi:hypothetical protein